MICFTRSLWVLLNRKTIRRPLLHCITSFYLYQTVVSNTYTDQEISNLNGTVVHLNGDETINGVKTFTEFIILPSGTPTADDEAVNKKYVDDFLAGLTWRISLEYCKCTFHRP